MDMKLDYGATGVGFEDRRRGECIRPGTECIQAIVMVKLYIALSERGMRKEKRITEIKIDKIVCNLGLIGAYTERYK